MSTNSPQTPPQPVPSEHEAKVLIKRWEFLIGAVTLLGILTVSVTTLVQVFLKQASMEGKLVVDQQTLRDATQMPLEGKWQVRIDYDKYFGVDEPGVRGEGMAVFTWAGDGYDGLLSGGIYRPTGTNVDDRVPMVVMSIEGKIQCSAQSTVPTEFPFKYVVRKADAPYDKAVLPGSIMIEANVCSSGGELTSFTAYSNFTVSNARYRFTRID